MFTIIPRTGRTPRRRSALYACVAVSVGITAVSCRANDVVDPRGDVVGRYVLRSIAGSALPATGNSATRLAFTIVADTIRVYSDGSGEETLVSIADGATVSGVQRNAIAITFPSAGIVELEYSCNDRGLGFGIAATCISPPHHRGVQTGTGWLIDSSLFYRVPLVYERLPTP